MSDEKELEPIWEEWWLATRTSYGTTGELVDGAHGSIEEVEKAAYLMNGLGLTRGRKFVAVKISHYEVTPKAHDTNHEAMGTMANLVKGARDE